jgi:L-amino acid N-acyltransferase YncA
MARSEEVMGLGVFNRWGARMKTLARTVEYRPKDCILVNGELVTFKLLERSDEAALRTFFSQTPEHEVESLRDDVRDPATISQWIATLDYERVLPLVAWTESLEQMAAVASLHRMHGVYRHIADVRIFVGKGYRKLGLGSALIKELTELGNRVGLYFLRAEILSGNELAVKAFRQLGFEVKCTLDEYFLTAKGQTRDVTLMLKRLRFNMEEDFFYIF